MISYTELDEEWGQVNGQRGYIVLGDGGTLVHPPLN
jgi:hypothetical protein